MKPSQVIPFVCEELEISKEEFESSDRCRYLVEARWIASGILTEHFGMSSRMVAKLIGKERSTISFGLKHLKESPRFRPQLAQKYAGVLRRLPQAAWAGNAPEVGLQAL